MSILYKKSSFDFSKLLFLFIINNTIETYFSTRIAVLTFPNGALT